MNSAIKSNADRILHEFGLLDRLEEIGKAHIIGSYRMDMMAWNDLDIDIENDSVSLEELYDLTAFIMRVFRPVWYEAKQEVNSEGKTVWFHGFETMITGELWNVDLWFFDRETISAAEAYCDDIKAKAAPEQKRIMVEIKRDLISRGMYSFEQFRSIDVYKAVLNDGVMSTEEFLQKYKRTSL